VSQVIFFSLIYFTMGVAIEVWRVRIGCFVPNKGCCYKENKYSYQPGLPLQKGFFMNCFIILSTLLVIGGVEMNPGPGPTLEQIKDIISSTIETSEKTLLSKISDLILDSKKETINAINEVKSDENKLNEQVVTLEKDLADAKTKISTLESNNVLLNKKVDFLENSSRKCNVIVFGLLEADGGNQPDDDFCVFANSMLGVEVDRNSIDQCYRIGKNTGKRPLFVSFNNFKEKLKIMNNVSKLKGTKISVTDDLTPTARENKKILLKCASQARANDHIVKIRNASLLIDGVEFKLETLVKPGWLRLLESHGRERSDSQSSAQSKKRLRYEKSSDGDESESDEVLDVTGSSQQGNAKPPPTEVVGGEKQKKTHAKKHRHKKVKGKSLN
jgi:hypothetical protein